MSKSGIAVACAAALLATTQVAMAADPIDEGYDLGTWYVSATGGIVSIFETDFDGSPPVGEGDVEFDYGGRGGVALGHYWAENWRSEIEFAYASAKADEFSPDGGGGEVPLNGSLDIFTVLAKIDYEMQFGWWRPYVGVGAGVAVLSADGIGAGGGAPAVDDSDTVFAGAIEAGSKFIVSDQVEIFTQSQLLIMSDADFKFSPAPGSGTLEMPLVWSSSLGLRFRF